MLDVLENRIREILIDLMPSCHCKGCDGWMCGGPDMSGQEDEVKTNEVLSAIMQAFRSEVEKT